jgi:diguanylate cyclase (GGDEF)-like protein
LWQTILEGNVFTHRVENRNFNGNTHWYIVTIAPDINQYGDINGYISFYQDIDDKVALETNAAIDYLTGLYNRATFDTKLSEEIARAQCHLTPLTVILVDIDHFKYVNDAYGHEIGDLVLRDIASILTQHARQNDLVARWGGEEFVVLCPNTDAIGASQLAQTLRTNIEQHVFHKVGHKTASFGVADYQIDMDQQTLFNHADAALYQAKETGRNQVVVFSSIAH